MANKDIGLAMDNYVPCPVTTPVEKHVREYAAKLTMEYSPPFNIGEKCCVVNEHEEDLYMSIYLEQSKCLQGLFPPNDPPRLLSADNYTLMNKRGVSSVFRT